MLGVVGSLVILRASDGPDDEPGDGARDSARDSAQAADPASVESVSDLERAKAAYTQGRLLARVDGNTPEALQSFELAVRLDPDYLPALVALAETAASSHDRSPETLDRALAAAERAVELAPDGQQSQLARAWIEVAASGDLAGAEERHRELASRFPESAQAHARLSWILAARGDATAGTAAARRALDVAADRRGFTLGLVALYVNRDFEEVIARIEGSAWLDDPESASGLHLYAGLARLALGDLPGVSAEADRVLELGVSARRRGDLGYLLAATGRRAEAEQILRQVESATYRDPYALAQIHHALGDRDQALEHLCCGIEDDITSRIRLLADPTLDGLRGDARYPVVAAG